MAAMIGLQDPLQAQPVAQSLQGMNLRRVDAVYYRVRAGNTWSYQAQYLNPGLPSGFEDAVGYLLWTMASNVAPDVVVIYAPGTSAAGSSLGGYRWSAGGLGLQWDVEHIPLIIAGNGVSQGLLSRYPARLVDIAPTIAAAMGLRAPKVDGVVLADALQQPSATDVRRQRETAHWLDPLVRALSTRAAEAGG
jgi:hypothetical protein